MRVAYGGAGTTRPGLLALGPIILGWVIASTSWAQTTSSTQKSAPIVSPTQGQKPATTTAPGQKNAPVPTYAKDVAAILQAKCQNCHRKHQVGPFALETYEQARKRSHDIASVTEERSMPPWKPTPGVGPKLKHDQSLTPDELAVLAAWAEAGAPLGDPKDLPPPRKFADGWKLGPPDVILEPAEGYAVPASGPDIYRCFVLPTNLARDSYLEAVDYSAGEKAAVHHLIAYIDTTGRARQLDAADPAPGYTSRSGSGIDGAELGFWTAGGEPHRLPDGIGIHLPPQSDIVLQVHYHPTGKVGNDKTRVGLYFAQAGQASAALEQRVQLQFPTAGRRSERRGQGELVHPRGRRGHRRLPPHASPRP